MVSRAALLAFLASGALAFIACKRPSAAIADGGAPPDASSAAAIASSSPSPSSSSFASNDAGPMKPLELLQFRITSGIENKKAKDTLTTAVPGQRVWAHLTIRNRSATTRQVRLVFRVNGDERTTVSLDIDPSWSFRTWGYNTLRDLDTGELDIEVTDDTGKVMVSDKLPIVRAKDAGKAK